MFPESAYWMFIRPRARRRVLVLDDMPLYICITGVLIHVMGDDEPATEFAVWATIALLARQDVQAARRIGLHVTHNGLSTSVDAQPTENS